MAPVEFADKFDDNKVEKWKEYYVDYDKIRSLIAKIKGASEAYESLAKISIRKDIAAGIEPSAVDGPEWGLGAKISEDDGVDLGVVKEDERCSSETKALVEIGGKGGAYGSADVEIGSNQNASKQKLAEWKTGIG
eukprot:CAMPEP_0172564268 /NCGR_PEP_ID=MMETSP1067-20121228/103783_1 /TAXON_ID=265564 ORGANISM="Thalassiosira punctigera, Strain Tpunct2005C2" /NCGR_SAMPLE_ID=MMETSP1067 /ASSEMBLY_ACC=CAM_ASM_000444 /LENGTH=134 /DNA_ID=CAMNT_0013354897 /DNA_START=130 /DNA_END=530 /DNA_ORIENTATION=+